MNTKVSIEQDLNRYEVNLSNNIWRACSFCKKPIHNRQSYYECSVSTCTGKRTGYVFCSVACWETHLPGARHKSAYAIEETAPATGVWTPTGPTAAGGSSAGSANSNITSGGSGSTLGRSTGSPGPIGGASSSGAARSSATIVRSSGATNSSINISSSATIISSNTNQSPGVIGSSTNSSQSKDSKKIIVSRPGESSSKSAPPIPREILIVASKLKEYVRLKSEMNTSASVMEALSDIIRELCDEAIDKARQEGRKTLMDRDF